MSRENEKKKTDILDQIKSNQSRRAFGERERETFLGLYFLK